MFIIYYTIIVIYNIIILYYIILHNCMIIYCVLYIKIQLGKMQRQRKW